MLINAMSCPNPLQVVPARRTLPFVVVYNLTTYIYYLYIEKGDKNNLRSSEKKKKIPVKLTKIH